MNHKNRFASVIFVVLASLSNCNSVLGQQGTPFGTGCYNVQTHECTNSHCTAETCEAAGGHFVGEDCAKKGGRCCEGEGDGDVCQVLGYIGSDGKMTTTPAVNSSNTAEHMGEPYGTGCYDIQTHQCSNAHCTLEECTNSGGSFVDETCADAKCCEGEGDVCSILGYLTPTDPYTTNGHSDVHGSPYGTGCYNIQSHQCSDAHCTVEDCEASGGMFVDETCIDGKCCEGEGDVCTILGHLHPNDEYTNNGISSTHGNSDGNNEGRAPYGTGCYIMELHECTNAYCTQEECEANGGTFIASEGESGRWCEGEGDVCDVLGYLGEEASSGTSGNDNAPFGTGCYMMDTHECTNTFCTKQECEANGGMFLAEDCIDGKCCEGTGDVCKVLGYMSTDGSYVNAAKGSNNAPYGTGCYMMDLHECTDAYCTREECELNGGHFIGSDCTGGKCCEGVGDVCEVLGYLDTTASSGTGGGNDNAPYGTGCYMIDTHECTNAYCTKEECTANGGTFLGSDCIDGKCCEGVGDVCEVLGYLSVDGAYVSPNNNKSGMSTGAIVGLSLGIVAGMVMLFLAFKYVKTATNEKQADTGAKNEIENSEGGTSNADSGVGNTTPSVDFAA